MQHIEHHFQFLSDVLRILRSAQMSKTWGIKTLKNHESLECQTIPFEILFATNLNSHILTKYPNNLS